MHIPCPDCPVLRQYFSVPEYLHPRPPTGSKSRYTFLRSMISRIFISIITAFHTPDPRFRCMIPSLPASTEVPEKALETAVPPCPAL